MNYIKIVIIGIVLMLPLSGDCQDSLICINRDILEKVAVKLDSFDVLKLEKYKYKEYKVFSDSLLNTQLSLLNLQDVIIDNKDKEILSYKKIDNQHQIIIDTSNKFNDYLRKENKKLKTKNKIFLIGGGVLSIGLTTALLITLF